MNPPEAPSGEPRLPGTLRLGAVHLTVSGLDRSIGFYERAIGLRVHSRDGGEAALGAGGGDLLVLVEDAAARPRGRHAGLFHFALLSDSREELGHALARLLATRTRITGASDHGVSEAIYLSDPDGNGIELYADRPREEWPGPSLPGSRVGIFTAPLDLQPLADLVEGDPRPQAGSGLSMGHVHLQVNDIAAARGFHAGLLGFEVMLDIGSAAFLAAGGYHHHLGVNVWGGEGIPAARGSGTLGLRHWTVVLEDANQVAAVEQRLGAAEVLTTAIGSGFLAGDPAGLGVAVVAPG